MRETRLYGSEGGEVKTFPTPIPYRDALTKNRTDGAMVRLIMACKPDEDFTDADRRLTEFIKKLNPHLGAYIPP